MPTDRTPGSTESQEAEQKKPEGIEGLLRVYYAYMLIAVGLSICQLFPLIGSWFSGKDLLVFSVFALNLGLFTFAVVSLKRFGESWVRIFHVSLNGVMALIALTVVVSSSLAPDMWSLLWVPSTLVSAPWTLVRVPRISSNNSYLLLQLVVPLLWAAYWLTSRRIRNTYVDLRIDNDLFAKSGWLGFPFFKVGLAVTLVFLFAFDASISSARGTQNPLIGMPSAYAATWFARAVMLGATVILLSVGTWLGRQNNNATSISNNESQGQHKFMLAWGLVLGLAGIGMLAAGVYLSAEQLTYNVFGRVSLRILGYGIVAAGLLLIYQVWRGTVIRLKLLRS